MLIVTRLSWGVAAFPAVYVAVVCAAVGTALRGIYPGCCGAAPGLSVLGCCSGGCCAGCKCGLGRCSCTAAGLICCRLFNVREGSLISLHFIRIHPYFNSSSFKFIHSFIHSFMNVITPTLPYPSSCPGWFVPPRRP